MYENEVVAVSKYWQLLKTMDSSWYYKLEKATEFDGSKKDIFSYSIT